MDVITVFRTLGLAVHRVVVAKTQGGDSWTAVLEFLVGAHLQEAHIIQIPALVLRHLGGHPTASHLPDDDHQVMKEAALDIEAVENHGRGLLIHLVLHCLVLHPGPEHDDLAPGLPVPVPGQALVRLHIRRTAALQGVEAILVHPNLREAEAEMISETLGVARLRKTKNV